MALFGNVSEDYTKTGKGMLSGIADKLSYVPGIGGMLAWPIGMLGTVIEAGKWLFQGKARSAFTVLAAGTVGNSVNAFMSGGSAMAGIGSGGLTWWMANVASGVATGETAGKHAQALTEKIVGGLTGATVTASYPAAIGSIGSSYADSRAPQGSFRDQIASERGMTRAQMDARADQAYVNNTQSSTALGA